MHLCIPEFTERINPFPTMALEGKKQAAAFAAACGYNNLLPCHSEEADADEESPVLLKMGILRYRSG